MSFFFKLLTFYLLLTTVKLQINLNAKPQTKEKTELACTLILIK